MTLNEIMPSGNTSAHNIPTALRTTNLATISLQLDLTSVSAAFEEVVGLVAPAGSAFQLGLGHFWGHCTSRVTLGSEW